MTTKDLFAREKELCMLFINNNNNNNNNSNNNNNNNNSFDYSISNKSVDIIVRSKSKND